MVAGALAALAMPPLYWLPLAIVGIVAYVWLWQAAPTPLSAFWRGLAWGTGHFAVGSYWILEAFYVPPADFAAAAWLCWRSPGRLQSGCAGTSSPAMRGIHWPMSGALPLLCYKARRCSESMALAC